MRERGQPGAFGMEGSTRLDEPRRRKSLGVFGSNVVFASHPQELCSRVRGLGLTDSTLARHGVRLLLTNTEAGRLNAGRGAHAQKRNSVYPTFFLFPLPRPVTGPAGNALSIRRGDYFRFYFLACTVDRTWVVVRGRCAKPARPRKYVQRACSPQPQDSDSLTLPPKQ